MLFSRYDFGDGRINTNDFDHVQIDINDFSTPKMTIREVGRDGLYLDIHIQRERCKLFYEWICCLEEQCILNCMRHDWFDLREDNDYNNIVARFVSCIKQYDDVDNKVFKASLGKDIRTINGPVSEGDVVSVVLRTQGVFFVDDLFGIKWRVQAIKRYEKQEKRDI